MPIYEFICKKCNKKFETLVKIGKEKEVSCPNCGSSNLEKLLSSFGIGGESNKLSSSSACSVCSTKTCSTCK